MLIYPAAIAPDGDGWVVSFRDIPEALTGAPSKEAAIELAKDALITAMDFYVEDDREVPMPSQPQAGEELIELPLSQAAKVLLLNEMIRQRVRPAELANRLHTSRQDVNRLVNLKHTTKIDGVEAAFKSLGRTLRLELA